MWPRLFLGPRHGLHSSRFASLTLFILKFPLSLLLFVSITVFFFSLNLNPSYPLSSPFLSPICQGLFFIVSSQCLNLYMVVIFPGVGHSQGPGYFSRGRSACQPQDFLPKCPPGFFPKQGLLEALHPLKESVHLGTRK